MVGWLAGSVLRQAKPSSNKSPPMCLKPARAINYSHTRPPDFWDKGAGDREVLEWLYTTGGDPAPGTPMCASRSRGPKRLAAARALGW